MIDTKTNVLLTTIDNPFNPFEEWDEWLAWDASAGYHTPSYLARIVNTSYELSEVDQDRAIVDAMNEIISFNINGKYKLIYSE